MPPTSDTDHLVRAAGAGDVRALEQLLLRYRVRLRNMVAIRLDRRVAPRVDPSDIVQEASLTAAARIRDYAEQRPLPFYPWLRSLAVTCVADVHRRHVTAGKRSVAREAPEAEPLPDASAAQLVDRLVGNMTEGSERAMREERRTRVRQALLELAPTDREVLVLRYLEQLPTREAAAVLGINEGAFVKRQLRALQRLRKRMDHEID